MKPIVALLLVAASIGRVESAHADTFTLDLEQVGLDVIGTGSGSIDTTEMKALKPSSGTPAIKPAGAEFEVGDFSAGFLVAQALFGPTTGTPFGTAGTFEDATSGTGDAVGLFFNGSEETIGVPNAYVSDAPLGDTTTWSDATFASLGLTTGTYTYDYGSLPDTIVVEVGTGTPPPTAVPEPASFALLGAALVGISLARRRFTR